MTTPAPIDDDRIDNAHTWVVRALNELRQDLKQQRFGQLVLTDRISPGGGPGQRTKGPPTLVDALCVAAATRRPLLLTGVPGVGKTAVAAALVEFLRSDRSQALAEGLAGTIENASLTFSTRTDREALLGGIDHISRLAVAQENEVGEPDEFFRTGVFGAAFRPKPGAEPTALVPRTTSDTDVVVLLLDEIDKAEPSLPNDLLDAIDRKEFKDDLGRTHSVDAALFTVITSNAERDLPDAFMRRCIPFHIDVPDRDALVAIGKAVLTSDVRLKGLGSPSDAAITRLAETFADHADSGQGLERKPGTAEFIDLLVTVTQLGLGDDPDWMVRLAPLLWTKRRSG